MAEKINRSEWKCVDCSYHVGSNHCPLYEQKPDNTECVYFNEW